jgi:hypothetical protein
VCTPVLDSELTGMATWEASSIGSNRHSGNSTATATAYVATDVAGGFEQGDTADGENAFQGQCESVHTSSNL